ncbi:MFS transporter [Brevibacterium sp. 50QC2O2]|uniref:MFS transporter n=1 Tax=unclassified Brevibacterium TaxID=2614124 RepID=UPI00211B8FAB|nr:MULTISPECIES: MFS transporter [unclassified Brevibacterium]MCQ9369129.1 MFS transporter [Brevibacterium sp. 91QC2O2]MCQ9387050.1 MFS transporter [Brevibacterium sp. 50QC2O2]
MHSPESRADRTGAADPWVRNLVVATFGTFTTIVGMTMLIPFLPVYIRALGVTDDAAVVTWSAVCFGATFLVAAVTAPLWGWMGDRWGRKSMLVRSSLGMAVAIGITGLAGDVWWLLAFRVLTGLLGGFASGASILVADQTPPGRRAFALGVLTSGNMAGSLLGPVLGGILPESIGPRACFAVVGGLIFVAFLGVVLFMRNPPALAEAPPGVPAKAPAATSAVPGGGTQVVDRAANQPTAQLPRVALPVVLTVLVAVSGLITFAQLAVEPFITVYMGELLTNAGAITKAGATAGAEATGASGATAALGAGAVGSAGLANPTLWGGIALAATAAGTMVAGPFLGRAADRYGNTRMLIWSLLAGAVVSLVQPLTGSVWVFTGLRFVLGLAMGGLMPALTAGIRDMLPANRVGRVLGLTVAAQHAGRVFGPVLAAVVANLWGMPAALVASGLVLAIAAVAVWGVRPAAAR